MCDFDDMVMTFELTLYTPYMLKISPIIRESRHGVPLLAAVRHADRDLRHRGADVSSAGTAAAGRSSTGRSCRKACVEAKQKGKFPDPEHKENFVQCIRSRQTPNADIEEGHRSALLIHYANISYRLGGQKLRHRRRRPKQIVGNAEAMKLFRREYRKPWVIPDEV